MKRLIIVGPVPPVRGGIARHTFQLANAASTVMKTELLTPRKVFPRLLYPGKDQFADRNEAANEFNLDMSIKKGSWSQILISLLRLKEPGDVLGILIVWWTWFLAPVTLAIGLIASMRGIKATLYCHNVLPHNVGLIGKAVTIFTLQRFKSFIVQSGKEARLLANFQGSSKIKVIGHPIYEPIREYSPQSNTSLTGRKFLFFGLIRPYKGVGHLMALIPKLEELEVSLTIAGEAWDKKIDSELRVLAESFERFSYLSGYASEELKSRLFSDASALILPYESATGSGVLADAIGFELPVIVSDVVEKGERFREGRDGITVNLRENPAIALSEAIREFAAKSQNYDSAWRAETGLPTWSQCAKEVLSSFHE